MVNEKEKKGKKKERKEQRKEKKKRKGNKINLERDLLTTQPNRNMQHTFLHKTHTTHPYRIKEFNIQVKLRKNHEYNNVSVTISNPQSIYTHTLFSFPSYNSIPER